MPSDRAHPERVVCKDCEAVAAADDPRALGWRWEWVEGDPGAPSPIDGWRCPDCVAAWEAWIAAPPQEERN
jgi:hypothetical protein